MKSRVVVKTLRPAGVAQAVGAIFGRPMLAALERRTLFKHGEQIASGFTKVREKR